MKKGRKPYENKNEFDPARLNHEIDFYTIEWQPDEFGGGENTTTLRLSTRGSKEPVSINSLSQMQQLGIIAGESVLGQSYYVRIRKRNGFTPLKDMRVDIDGESYVLRGVLPQDDPVTFIKILCSRTNYETSASE